jgi:ankyrin repeat protein
LIFLAAQTGSLYAAQRLMQVGVDPTVKDNQGRDAISVAINSGDLELVDILVAGAPNYDHVTPQRGHSSLSQAIVMGNRLFLEKYIPGASLSQLNRPNLACGRTLAQTAIFYDNEQALQTLQARGVCMPKNPVHKAAKYGSVHVIKYLSDRDYSVHKRDKKGNTPFIVAAKNGQKEACLLLAGCLQVDVDAKNKVEKSALDYTDRPLPWLPKVRNDDFEEQEKVAPQDYIKDLILHEREKKNRP